MQSKPPQAEPAPLRISYRALERLRQAYPTRFDPTIQALRIRCRLAYRDWRLPGLLAAWVGILWQLQVTLPQTAGLPSLWRLLVASKRRGTRPAVLPALRLRPGVRLYYRRRPPSRYEIILSILALLVLLPMFLRFFEEESTELTATPPPLVQVSPSAPQMLQTPAQPAPPPHSARPLAAPGPPLVVAPQPYPSPAPPVQHISMP
jgi:hypothetical protein